MYPLLHHRGSKHHFSPGHGGRNQIRRVEVSAAVAGLVAVCRGAKAALAAVSGGDWGVKSTAATADRGSGRAGYEVGSGRAVERLSCDPAARQQKGHWALCWRQTALMACTCHDTP